MSPPPPDLPRDRLRRGGAGLRGPRVDDAARRLRDMLRCDIFAGVYGDGLLPSEGDLMEQHSARRAAVREALGMLRAEGVVERVQGIGTFAVRERLVTGMGTLHGTTDETDSELLTRIRRPEVVERAVVPAPPFVAAKLGVEPGEQVLLLEYVASINERFALCTNYVAFPEAEAMRETPFERDWYLLLEESGLELGGTEWVLSAVGADPSVARHVGVAPGTALMLGEELVWDNSGRVYNFAVCYFRTDHFVFRSRAWTIETRDGATPIVSTDEISARDHSA